MLGRRQIGICPAVWVGLLALCGRLWADPSAQFPTLPRARSANVPEAATPNPSAAYYFGVMGQVAKPGVYELDTPKPQLAEVIHHAGGLTQKATHQIRIVRQGNAGQSVFYSPGLHFKLVAGDIVVADGPRESEFSQHFHRTPPSSSVVQTADFSEARSAATPVSFRHVALVDVLDRPVILPVPQTHANVPAILAYLGQAPSLASKIKVVPVGGRPRGSTKDKAVPSNFRVPTVLYFAKQQVQADRLPLSEFPQVYRAGQAAPVAPNPLPGERRTAESTPPGPPPLTVPLEEPRPIERFQRPLPHSVVALPPPPTKELSEPPLIAEVRDLENRIPDPEPLPSPKKSSEAKSPPVEKPVAPNAEEKPTRDSQAETSPWFYTGLVLLVLVVAGTYAKLRWKRKRPDSNAAKTVHAEISSANENPLNETTTAKAESESKPAVLPGRGIENLVGDEVLNALVFNQMPVLEESAEPAPKDTVLDQPKSQKTFRIDPPTQQDAAKIPKPFLVKRPRVVERSAPEPSRETPASEVVLQSVVERPPANPKPAMDAEESQTQPSLLDRVLQQVNQPRAA